jgi:hypothetical protein
MSNSYLIQLDPSVDAPTRRVVHQQWYETLALALQTRFGGTAPTTGGYLVDTTPNDDPSTVACATVAWLSNAVAQV